MLVAIWSADTVPINEAELSEKEYIKAEPTVETPYIIDSGHSLGYIVPPGPVQPNGQVIFRSETTPSDSNAKELIVNGSVSEPPASELLEIERQTRRFEQQLESTKPQDVKAQFGTGGV